MVPLAYDERTAVSSWWLNKVAYCDAGSIERWTCPSCVAAAGRAATGGGSFVDVAVLDYDEARAFVAYSAGEGRIVAVFRGSANVNNWIANLDLGLADYDVCAGCRVHRGFLRLWQGLRALVVPAVRALQTRYPAAPVFVTGYSLGAALATVAAVDLAGVSGVRHVFFYGIGGPRVGNAAYVAFAVAALPEGRRFRVNQASDPVPLVPPASAGYRHIPREVYYPRAGRGGAHTLCSDSPAREDARCSNRVLFWNVLDHMSLLGVSNYCDP